jgi:MarR family 2-MHQ and catechol resistance regulon transcriptional repressor
MIMPTHYQGTPREILALNTFIKLTRSVESLMSRLSHLGTLQDLTLTQFGVLEVLYHLGPMCQHEIGDKLLKSGGNITLVIDNLEKLGLVHRERSEQDRRMIIVHLTEAGKTRIEQVLPGHIAAITKEMNSLESAEQETLGRLCRKLGKPAQKPG